MRRRRLWTVIGIGVLLLIVTLLPNSAYAVTSIDPPVARPQVPLIDAGTIIIFFSVCGVVVIGVGVGLYFLIRWLRKLRL